MSNLRGFTPRTRQQGLASEQVDGETLLYVEETHQAFCLNASAARIWALCDGRRTVATISAEAGQEEEVVADALHQFAKSGLLDSFPEPPNRLSRRRILKDIGLAAIPIVLMVAAPEARAAASCARGINNGGAPCTPAEPCCVGVCNESQGTCN